MRCSLISVYYVKGPNQAIEPGRQSSYSRKHVGRR